MLLRRMEELDHTIEVCKERGRGTYGFNLLTTKTLRSTTPNHRARRRRGRGLYRGHGEQDARARQGQQRQDRRGARTEENARAAARGRGAQLACLARCGRGRGGAVRPSRLVRDREHSVSERRGSGRAADRGGAGCSPRATARRRGDGGSPPVRIGRETTVASRSVTSLDELWRVARQHRRCSLV